MHVRQVHIVCMFNFWAKHTSSLGIRQSSYVQSCTADRWMADLDAAASARCVFGEAQMLKMLLT